MQVFTLLLLHSENALPICLATGVNTILKIQFHSRIAHCHHHLLRTNSDMKQKEILMQTLK